MVRTLVVREVSESKINVLSHYDSATNRAIAKRWIFSCHISGMGACSDQFDLAAMTVAWSARAWRYICTAPI